MRGTLGRASRGLFGAVTLIASGCISLQPYDPGPGKRVAASVIQDTYLSGEPINVTVANLSEVTLFYPDGSCKTELQRRDGTAWTTVSEHFKNCPTDLGFLDPGQAVVHQYRLPQGVTAGIYRLVMPMPAPEDADAAEVALLTPIFKVESSLKGGLASSASLTVNSNSAPAAPTDR